MRSSLLSLVLLVALAFVGMRIHAFWQEGPWELPQPRVAKEISASGKPGEEPRQRQLASTKSIVEKNLFDPERGAGQTREAEASSAAMQRIRRMILLGTAILGNSRYAILQDPLDARGSGPRPPSGSPPLLRLKLGDAVEGFKLSEIDAKRVVFTKGASRVEIPLDFSRKVEEPGQKTPAPAPAPPRLPARPRIAPSQPGMAPAPPAGP